jgi:hypothetical protein
LRIRSALACALVAIGMAGVANAEHGTGSLFVAGATNTPTKWNIPSSSSTTAEIRGVSTSEVGNPLPPTIDVFVKSSDFGNVAVIAVRIGTTADYTFTYTPASPGGMPMCGTTVVAYARLGLNTNNDLLDDGQQNGSRKASAGFRFVDASGRPEDCPLGVEASLWGLVKARYR